MTASLSHAIIIAKFAKRVNDALEKGRVKMMHDDEYMPNGDVNSAYISAWDRRIKQYGMHVVDDNSTVMQREQLYRSIMCNIGIEGDGNIDEADVSFTPGILTRHDISVAGTEGLVMFKLLVWSLGKVSPNMQLSEHLREVAYQMQCVWKEDHTCYAVWDMRGISIAQFTTLLQRITDGDMYILVNVLKLFPTRTAEVVLVFEDMWFLDRTVILTLVTVISRVCSPSMYTRIHTSFQHTNVPVSSIMRSVLSEQYQGGVG
jgi:hypothetical protein